MLLDTEHRPAVAVLRRARRAGRPGRPARAHHPSGEEPHRGSPLRRGAATAARRHRGVDPRRARLPALPRPDPDLHPGDRVPTPAPRARVRRPGARRSRARRPLPGVGLHGGQHQEPGRPDAPHPRRRVRLAATAALPSSPSPRCRTTWTTRSTAGSPGTFTVPSYLTGDGSPGTGSRTPRRRTGRAARSATATSPPGSSATSRSPTADGNDPVHPARGGVYGHGLLGSNDEVNAGNVRTMGQRAQLRLLRDEVGRLLRGRHRSRRPRCRTSLELPEGRRPHAAGLPELPVPRPAGQGPARLRVEPRVPGRCGAHAGARRHRLLRRQQPGRDPRRRRHRALHRVDARRARRARA